MRQAYHGELTEPIHELELISPNYVHVASTCAVYTTKGRYLKNDISWKVDRRLESLWFGTPIYEGPSKLTGTTIRHRSFIPNFGPQMDPAFQTRGKLRVRGEDNVDLTGKHGDL